MWNIPYMSDNLYSFACLADASFLVLLHNAIDNFVMYTVDRKIYVVIPI